MTQINLFSIVAQTDFPTNVIQIEIDQTACGCRYQIDAVEIIGKLPGSSLSYDFKINSNR